MQSFSLTNQLVSHAEFNLDQPAELTVCAEALQLLASLINWTIAAAALPRLWAILLAPKVCTCGVCQ